MNRKPGVIASVLLIALMAALSVWAWPQIPAGRQIAIHWDAVYEAMRRSEGQKEVS